MKIYNFIAYDADQNLGRAYNACMDLVDDDDWVVFLDHDAMFVQRNWYKNVKRIIEENPEYGFFTCLMNRVGCRWQIPGNVDPNNHDIRYHKEVGKALEQITENEVQDVTKAPGLSGVVMIVQKKVWDKIGGAKDGFLGVDNELHYACARNGVKVGLIRSLYVYHFYRADGDRSHLK